MSEEKKSESSRLGVVVFVGVFILLGVAIPFFAAVAWPHIHGATPADLAHLSMSGSPEAFARDAPSSEESAISVSIHMKTSEYERVDVDWPYDDLSAPNAMRLRPEHHAHQPEVAVSLGRWLPLHNDRYEWGAVRFRVDDNDGDIRFSVDRNIDGKANPMFDRQVEAARELLLNAAFGLPVTATDAELADTLGMGYPVVAVGKSEVFGLPIEQGPAFAAAHFPAATRGGSDNVTIPLDHPYVRSVRLRWANPHGAITSIDLETTDTYAGVVGTLVTCLTPKLGTPAAQVTAGKQRSVFTIGGVTLTFGSSIDVGMATRTGVSPADWATIFDALDGCRESSESGSKSRRR